MFKSILKYNLFFCLNFKFIFILFSLTRIELELKDDNIVSEYLGSVIIELKLIKLVDYEDMEIKVDIIRKECIFLTNLKVKDRLNSQ